MGFLVPGFLAAVGLIGLPLWLHLLRRHRTTPMEFSSLMFFDRHIISSVKSRRLDFLLLLALRLAVLILLALAFAQPFLRTSGAAAQGPIKLYVLDISASMSAAGALDQARRDVLSEIAKLKPGERGQVALFDDQLHLATQPVNDADVLRSAVQSAQAGDGRTSFGELAKALRGQAATSHQGLEIHLFSDLQKSGMPDGFSELRLDEGSHLVLHKTPSPSGGNFTVERVDTPRRLQEPAKARVEAIVAGYGNPESPVPVSLVINGKVASTKTVTVPAGGKAHVEFTGLDAAYGWNRCEVRVDANDALPADNAMLFSVERSDPRRILFLTGPRAGRSPLYFRSALESSAQTAFVLDPQPAAQVPVLTAANLAFVVLDDPADLPSGAEDALRRYVESGGSLWIALGPGSASRTTIPVTGEKLAPARYAARGGARFFAFASGDETHPSLRQTNRWDGVRFFAAAAIEGDASRPIVRLSDGAPILWERTLGEGKVIVFGSGFDNVSNDFPLHPSFVPFVEQTARYLAGEEERAPLISAGSALDLRSGQSKTSSVEVLGPSGERILSLAESARAQVVTLEKKGFYEVRRSAGRTELVPVNIDRRESDLTPVPDDTLALWTGGGASASAAGTESTVEQKKNLGTSLLWLALLFALAESLLASRHLSLGKETA